MTAEHPVKTPKKLIEVALPLDAINVAAAREKSIRHGHPSTLHLWWARRPLAAARAVIFGQMVNDPSWKWELEHPGEVPPNNLKASWAASRKRLFAIIEDFVKWENTTNEQVLEKARAEIRKSWKETCELNKDHPQVAELFNPDKLPAFHDPFAGGGALPLEAQRLGLEAYASDLNPVAVLINKAMIEIPPQFAGRPPVNPESRKNKELIERQWKGAEGLAEDVRYYGQWMREEALRRVGHLYPPIDVTKAIAAKRPDLAPLVGKQLTAIAWLWARTVKSPNPAFRHMDVPLVSTFVLCSKNDKQAYVHPTVSADGYAFDVRMAPPPAGATDGTRAGKRAGFRCLLSGTPIDYDYIRSEGQAGRLGRRLLAVVADSEIGRVYISPSSALEAPLGSVVPSWKPEVRLHGKCRVNVSNYGLDTFADLFTPRQLVALTTFADLVAEAVQKVEADAVSADAVAETDALRLDPRAYAESVGLYLGVAASRTANTVNNHAVWSQGREQTVNLFSRQAIAMTWDSPEVNPFAGAAGDFGETTASIGRTIAQFLTTPGHAFQADAQTQSVSAGKLLSTDPPYYDNVAYADLSDFFYVWLRRALKPVLPQLFTTVSVPKAEELVATPYLHDSKEKAEAYFLDGMTNAIGRLAALGHPAFPVTVYYAFKQSETHTDEGTASTGWETFLEAILRAGFSIAGTWPMRTERPTGVKASMNVLASSVVLVCRPKHGTQATVSRRVLLRELNQVLPNALDEMTRGAGDEQSPVAPVDLSQAIIGPGMAVFSKYSAVLEADGTPMSVRTALQLINRFLAEDDFDHDTQFCLHWFEQYGWAEGKFGDADTLARAKGTSVDGVKQAGVLFSAANVVRLLKWSEYPSDWDPETDPRLPVWEALHHLIRVFKTQGESGAGKVLSPIQAKGEACRQLAYRLYTLSERAGRAEDARAYNEIVTSWSAIESAAAAAPAPKQETLFG